MTMTFQKHWPTFATALGTIALVALTLLPYNGNPSALFHTDERMNEYHPLPSGFVVLEVPAYDGSQYYQIARQMTAVLNPTRWNELRGTSPLSYAYQRILTPFAAWVLALGQEPLLPWSFLVLNIFSLVAACAVVLKKQNATPLHALAIAFCPSAMVGLHFALAEPLGLLLIALFLTRYTQRNKLARMDVLLLSLLVLSREVNILFVGTVLLYTLYKRQWKDSALVLIPIAVFFAFHATLFAMFGDIPFLTSAGARQLPLSAPIKLLLGTRGYDVYTLSAIALFVGFVLPTFVWTALRLIKGDRSFPMIATFLFLCLMLTLPDYIWGSITSVGRVITPMYPLAVFAFIQHRTRFSSLLTLGILLIGLGAGLGLALIPHPFFLA